MLSAILRWALKYENPTLDEFRRLSKVRISLIRILENPKLDSDSSILSSERGAKYKNLF